MPTVSHALSILAAIVLAASSAMHSLMGWPALRAKLVAAQVPADLLPGLAMGWHFGGVMMLAAAALALLPWLAARRGRDASPAPWIIVGLAYLGFTVVAVRLVGADGFLLIFLVPALLLLAAAALAPPVASPGVRATRSEA